MSYSYGLGSLAEINRLVLSLFAAGGAKLQRAPRGRSDTQGQTQTPGAGNWGRGFCFAGQPYDKLYGPVNLSEEFARDEAWGLRGEIVR